MNIYGELDLSCDYFDAEKLNMLRVIRDEIIETFGSNIKSKQLPIIESTIKELSSIKQTAEEKKASSAGYAVGCFFKTLVFIVLGIAGIVAVFLLIHKWFWRIWLLISIVYAVGKGIKDLASETNSEIRYNSSKNKRIAEARRKLRK